MKYKREDVGSNDRRMRSNGSPGGMKMSLKILCGIDSTRPTTRY